MSLEVFKKFGDFVPSKKLMAHKEEAEDSDANHHGDMEDMQGDETVAIGAGHFRRRG